MLRSGQFDNLQWSKLAEAHSANWEILRTRYDLPLQPIALATPLSKLAAESIKACREYLFTDTACNNGWQIGGLAGLLPIGNLEQYFTPALCDHLLVTFAYRFICDNLAPKTLSECLDAIYNCSNDSLRIEYKYVKKEKDKNTNKEKQESVEDKDRSRALRSNFIKPKKRSCEAYHDKIDAIFSFYKELLPRAVDLSSLVEADLALLKKEIEVRADEEYAAPNWMYSVTMACNWTRSPLAVKIPTSEDGKDDREKKKNFVFGRDYCNGDNLLSCLTQFLGSSAWGPILFGEATPGSKRMVSLPFLPIGQTEEEIERKQAEISPSIMELRLDSNNQPFACIPYIPDQTYRCPLPLQSYPIRGSANRYEIPTEVQRIFNSYLVERTFHGYAAVTALNCITVRQAAGMFDSYRNQYQRLPSVVRLRAPLVHSEWIQLIGDLIEQIKPAEIVLSFVEESIDHWNRLALPVLEEHFIRSVWLAYENKGVDEVLEEITQSLVRDDGQGRCCDRLNLYRLVPVAKRTPPPKADDVVNEVMKNAYLAGLGCKLGQTDGRWIDPGRATAFEVV